MMREISRFHVIALPTLCAEHSTPVTNNTTLTSRAHFILFDILSTDSLYKYAMRGVGFITSLIFAAALSGQVQTTPDPSKDPVYFCPMDRDIRSNAPGKCSRCGMKLVAAVPDPVEYHLDLFVTPRVPQTGEQVHLKFDVH